MRLKTIDISRIDRQRASITTSLIDTGGGARETWGIAPPPPLSQVDGLGLPLLFGLFSISPGRRKLMKGRSDNIVSVILTHFYAE